MIFLSVLASFVIDTFDVTVATCDVPWLDAARFEQVVGAEVGELVPEARRGLILTVDRCTDASVRLRISSRDGQLERVLEIGDIPDEARLRTIALALGEMLREPMTEALPPEASPPEVSPPSDAAETRAAPPEAPIEAAKVDSVSPPPKPEPRSELAKPNHRKLSVGLYLRGFPLAKTLAPEGRFGVCFDKWRTALGAYAMGWSSSLGTAYLTAVTLTAGPSLWRREGRVTLGLDALLELGAVVAYGKADKSTDYSPRFNIASGAHLAFWLGPGWQRSFLPLVTIEVGWLRGLNVFAKEKFEGGFEGLTTTVGITGAW